MDRFHSKNRRSRDKWEADCKDCKAKRDHQRNADPAGELKRRDRKLQARYGISAEKYEAMKAAQHGACAICRRQEDGALHVDHDHTTGSVRQLLCLQCNVVLGASRDSPDILRAALAYLERHQNADFSVR